MAKPQKSLEVAAKAAALRAQQRDTGKRAAAGFLPLARSEAALSLTHILFAFAALFAGAIAGTLQGMEKGGLLDLPGGIGYYDLVTAHGVLMALVFTTYFIVGFLYAGVARTLGTDGNLTAPTRRLGWLGLILMGAGTILSVTMILLGRASVLYTFYAPMQASPFFYVGLTLLVVGSWLSGYGIFHQYRYWRKTNQGKLSPLFGYMSVATMILWQVATLGVAAEVLLQLIPWSLGWVPTVNVMLSRMLFWYFGHPLVYFWLLPAYMVWYVIIPKVVGGKVFSDALARLSFILLITFSIPVGFHHQLMEPGIAPFWKFLQVVLTLMVVVPSLLTAFSILAMLEGAGRTKGGQGLFGWLKRLPWGDVRFFAPFVGMVTFIPAGAGGIINASNQMNAVVHNTLWVTGHFHLTVATTVALTFFGTAYWLIPYLTGRRLTKGANRLGMVQTVTWAIGMFFMSGAMHTLGLLGDPRRTSYSTYNDNPTVLAWEPLRNTMAIGGMILFLGVILLMGLILYLACFAPKGREEFPLGEVAAEAEATPPVLERWGIWIGITVALVLLAYTLPVIDLLQHSPIGSPPIRMW